MTNAWTSVSPWLGIAWLVEVGAANKRRNEQTLATCLSRDRSDEIVTPRTDVVNASECRHFRTHPSFWVYLAPLKFNDDISNGPRVIALTNTPTHKQILVKTIPSSPRYSCAGDNSDYWLTYVSISTSLFWNLKLEMGLELIRPKI